MNQTSKTLEFIEKAKAVHGDKYDYSKVEYINNKTKICIICPEHGEFWQIPKDHYGKHAGCPKCGILNAKRKTSDSREEFIEKANKKWNYLFDYSKVNYINSKTKVEIICPKHGSFWQRPNDHITGYGCPKCGIEKRSKQCIIPVEQMVEKIYNKFGDKIKLIESTYTKATEYATFECPIHGTFTSIPNEVLNTKYGCPKCGYTSGGLLNSLTTAEFIEKAKKVYGDYYDYSKVDYKQTEEKVCIICPKHGEFYITPHSFLSGSHCPKCTATLGELKIINYLENHNIPYNFQYKVDLGIQINKTTKVVFDFYLEYNSKIYIIEFNGQQHYERVAHFQSEEDFKIQLYRDEMVKNFCLEKNYIFIEIPYYKIDNVEDILNEYFINNK